MKKFWLILCLIFMVLINSAQEQRQRVWLLMNAVPDRNIKEPRMAFGYTGFQNKLESVGIDSIAQVFSSGVYILRVTLCDGAVRTEKLVKR